MADTFNNGIQIPNIPTGSARIADAGYIRIFARADRVYGILPNGTEVELTNVSGGGGEGFPVFIQDTTPVTSTEKYLWIQTNYQEPGGFTLWFEDGE